MSDEVEAVFQRALSVDVAGRFPTVGEFWNELRQAGGKGPMSLLPPAQAREAPTPSTSAPVSGSPAPTPTPRAVAQLARLEARRPPAVVVLSAAGAAVAALGIVGTLLVRHAGSAPVASSSPTATAAPLPSSLSVPVTPPPAPRPACRDGMVYVAGGQDFMGSDEGLPFEKPAHNIKLAPFCIDVHEVTTAKYLACSDAGKCKRAARTNDWEGITPDDRKTYDPLCNARDADAKARHPINCVDWERASTYCAATGGRLPSEAEWEFAARGSDGRTYPWGDTPPSAKHLNACGAECVAWGRAHHVAEKAMYKDDDGWANTAPVGSYPAGASKFGLMDVVGNVGEWVGDWYAPYTAGDLVDPQGPAEGTSRVMRGGAWNGAEASWVRPTFRFKSDPSLTSYGVGFRCAADPR